MATPDDWLRPIYFVQGDDPHVETQVDGVRVRAYVEQVDGRPACSRLVVERIDDGPPVTGEMLRRVPVASLVRNAPPPSMLRPREPMRRPEGFPEDGPTRENLRYVADTYRRAHGAGEPPAAAVAALGLPRSTAGRWIAAAREAGLLGRARDRKAGEMPPSAPYGAGPDPQEWE